MVELENKIELELGFENLDSAISFCDGVDLFSDVSSMLMELKENIDQASVEGLEKASEDNKDLQEMFITINGSIVTGGLIASITVNQSSKYSFIIGPTVDYSVFVEGGRGDVYPVTAKCLHWVDYGVDVFRMHSGPAKPRPFVEPAFERTDDGRALMFVEEAINGIL